MGMTLLRLLLLPVFLCVLLYDAGSRDHRHRWIAVGIFVIMAITDKLDGYLARKLNQTSKMGELLDPLADKLLIACSVMLLSFSLIAPPGYRLPWYIVAIVYGKDLIVALGCLALLSLVGKVTITPRPFGKAGTFLQLSLVIATLIAPDLARFSERFAIVLTRSLWLAVILITLVATVDYVLLGSRQLAESKRKEVEPARANEQ